MNDKPTPKPETIAIALGSGEAGGVPQVLASGKGFWAEQIMQLAFANGVAVRQDADLAQVLTALDLDAPIPVEAYSAVAEILVFVYRANASYNQRKQADKE
ncbi:flagellar protein FhlB [bacterium]|nr:flagellar protein FhlB [bacterium]